MIRRTDDLSTRAESGTVQRVILREAENLAAMEDASVDSRDLSLTPRVEQAGYRVSLVREFRFEAAHRLPAAPAGHKCQRLHGHSFQVELLCEGEVDQRTGWLMDFADIKRAFTPLHEQLDHRYLNELPGLENPTAENIARWIWTRLKPQLPLLTQVTIAETCSARCVFRG